MSGLDSRFQSGENKYMAKEALEECVLASREAYYKDPVKQVQMGFMASGGEFNDARNLSQWEDHKHPSFPIPN